MAATPMPVPRQKQIVVISGPTGVGKSDIAAQLCKLRMGIVVSADSVQAFRGVQIGANKPTMEERKETPHLLVDVVDATETYNAAEWHHDAMFCIQSLLQEKVHADTPRQEAIESEISKARQDKGYKNDEHLLPVVVGGTMMYVQWLVHGRPDAMQASSETIKRASGIIKHYQEDNLWDEAIQYVSSFGESFAARAAQLGVHDWYRLGRTLEIAFTIKDSKDKSLLENLYSGEREGGLEAMGYDVRCFFLCPDDRMQHTAVVDRRCEDMIQRGLLKETTELQLTGQLPEMATKAIGYRQTLDYLQRQNAADNDEAALDAYLNDFTTATRRYATQQMKWFRKDDRFAFVPVPLSQSKQDRVNGAAQAIARMCLLPRDEYEQELLPTKDDGSIPISEQTRQSFVKQGKGMKLYLFKRHLIKPGSTCHREVMIQADECTHRLQAKQRISNASYRT